MRAGIACHLERKPWNVCGMPVVPLLTTCPEDWWPNPLEFHSGALDSIAANLQHDERLLEHVEQHPETGRIWLWETSQPAVIVGRSNEIEREVNVDACVAANIPILRRCSGGGAVVLGAGCLCYSLYLPLDTTQRQLGVSVVTAAIMHRLATALSTQTRPVTVHGVSDLVVEGRKFSGNSQRWRRRSLLHHGTVLYDFPLETVARYLQFPSRIPDYRGQRGHLEFVANLPMTRAEIIQRLLTAWGVLNGQPTPSPVALLPTE